jgi:hypothetical protein
MRLRPVPPTLVTWLLISKILLIAAGALSSCARPATPAKSAVSGAGGASATAAAPAPPPLSLIPADVARTGLVATFLIPAPERSLASGVALVKQAAPLPLDAAGVRDMLLAQAGLPAEVATHLDLTAPVAGAAVAAGPGRSPLTAFSVAGRSAGDVTAMLAVLGRTVSRRGAAVQIENAGGDRGWFLVQGNIVVFADSEEALVRAGSLAVEARRGAKDDVSITLYPEMVARAAGTDFKTALSRLVGELEERAAASGNKLGPEGTRQLRDLAEYLGGTVTAELALHLDAARGASFLVRFQPKPGSKLETLSRMTRTVPLDPALLGEAAGGKDEAGFALTSGYGAATSDLLLRQRAKLPTDGGKPAIAAGRLLDALVEGLTGDLSMVGRAQPGLSAELIYPVRDAAKATQIQAALAATDKAALVVLLRAALQGERVTPKVIRARHESFGKVRALHATVQLTVANDVQAAMRKLIGPTGLDVFTAVVDGERLAVTVGPGAKARMAAIVAGKKGTASAALTNALAASAGRSLFYFLDLRQVVSLALAVGGDARLRALAVAMRTPMPLLGGARGDAQGQAFTLDLTIPPSCFSAMGSLIQAAMLMRN